MARKSSTRSRMTARQPVVLRAWLIRVWHALLAAATLSATAYTLGVVPKLLHPLFGGIPTDLYLGTVRPLSILMGGIGAYAASTFTQKSPKQGIEGPAICFALALLAVPFSTRGLAVAGGQLAGPRYGPLLVLAVLHVTLSTCGIRIAAACATSLASGSADKAAQDKDHSVTRRAVSTSILLLVLMQRLLLLVVWPTFFRSLATGTESSICVIGLFFTAVAALQIAIFDNDQSQRDARTGHFTLPRVLLLTVTLLAVQRRLFALPKVPYTAIPGRLTILYEAHSTTGLIVVAENNKDGYRFLRCDHSLLGGRFLGRTQGLSTELGDSIFSTFLLQEAIRLANIPARLASGQAPPQTLIIGLGAGIAADAMIHHRHAVDIIEIDPEVYYAARRYLGLSAASRSVVLSDAAKSVREWAATTDTRRGDPGSTYDYVIHDCFTGGSVPHEVFTVEFWKDMKKILQDDAIIAVNFAGTRDSQATMTVMQTLIASFARCRAFTDVHGAQSTDTGKELMNMVIFCSPSAGIDLEFRTPVDQDYLGSEIRRRVLSDFHRYEIDLATWRLSGNEILLHEGQQDLNRHQVDSALGTWHAMRDIMPVEMWRAY